MTEADPIIGNWYRHIDKGQEFEVIEIDEDQGVVEIQYFDGDLEEIDLDDWYEMEIVPTAEPENYSGPYDEAPEDYDMSYSETDMKNDDWNSPVDEHEDKE